MLNTIRSVTPFFDKSDILIYWGCVGAIIFSAIGLAYVCYCMIFKEINISHACLIVGCIGLALYGAIYINSLIILKKIEILEMRLFNESSSDDGVKK
jgi:hypothetical protein